MKRSSLTADKAGWRTVSETAEFENNFVAVTTDVVFTPTRQQNPAKWTVVHRKPAVIVAPITPSGELLLVRQERIPPRLVQWEFPAGQVDEDDADSEAILRATALRELREETGYELAGDGELIHLGVAFSSPGFTTEHCHMYFARGVVLSKLGTSYDEGEGITGCRTFPQNEFQRMVATGEINDAHTLALYGRMSARGLI